MLEEAFEALLNKYYWAQRTVNGEFSGDIAGDTKALDAEVMELSQTHLRKPFEGYPEWDRYIYEEEEC